MVDLTQRITVTSPEFDRIADDLQGNILKSHRRKFAEHVFVRFPDAVTGRRFLRDLAPRLTTARAQLRDDGLHDEFIGFGLSATGHLAINRPLPTPFSDPFVSDMRGRRRRLGDLSTSTWETEHRRRWHALIVLAHNDPNSLGQILDQFLTDLGDRNIVEICVESGAALDGEREHFGFRDGISVPILLSIDQPPAPQNWDPWFPLGQALVVDPRGSKGAESLGSFLVFRKLAQHRAGIHDDAGVHPDPVRAVGRHRDGMPLTVAGEVGNDFLYDDDPDGLVCPLDSHVRKANPRRAQDRSAQFVRRGIPYGASDGDAERGLLFVAYNANLSEQFERMQGDWIARSGFPIEATGPDAMMGAGSVELRGGGYFFAPSISGLTNLGHP